MKWNRREWLAPLLGLAFAIIPTLVSFAGEVTYSFPAEPAITKTIRFQLEGGADEYRFRKGAFGEEGFSGAKAAGNGSEAEITVEENGIYTLYACQEGSIYFVQVPVTMIDHTPPTIRITDIISTDEKRVSVYYEIDDYYGVDEVRYIAGNVPASGYDRAAITKGGVIEGLEEGTYTLFARDLAGNITAYAMAVTCDYSESQQSSQYESKSEAYESTEWAKTDLWVEPSATEPPPSVTEPEPSPPVTEPEIPRESVTYPDREPGTEPEGPPSIPGTVPTNPTVPPSGPPVERYPQTGSLLRDRALRTIAVTTLFAAGFGLLLLARVIHMRDKRGGGKTHHEE